MHTFFYFSVAVLLPHVVGRRIRNRLEANETAAIDPVKALLVPGLLATSSAFHIGHMPTNPQSVVAPKSQFGQFGRADMIEAQRFPALATNMRLDSEFGANASTWKDIFKPAEPRKSKLPISEIDPNVVQVAQELPDSFGSFVGWPFKFLVRSRSEPQFEVGHDDSLGIEYVRAHSGERLADAAYYVVDPNVKRSGKTWKRLHEHVLKRLKKKSKSALYLEVDELPDSEFARIEDVERLLSLELNTRVEVLMGPVYKPKESGQPIGFYKIIVLPTQRAVAGAFFDSRGMLTPIGGLPGVATEEENIIARVLSNKSATPVTARLDIKDIISTSADLFSRFDRDTSSALSSRLQEIIIGTSMPREKVESLTEEGIFRMYRRADTLMPRSFLGKLNSDVHTRNVYNFVADRIFRGAKDDVKKYIVKGKEPPLKLVKKYVELRDANKRCAQLRTTASAQDDIARRNAVKYEDIKGPGVDYKKLAKEKGNLNAILGSFKTSGKDLMLWGNRAGDKIETWKWAQGTTDEVESPWEVTDELVDRYWKSKKSYAFGFHGQII